MVLYFLQTCLRTYSLTDNILLNMTKLKPIPRFVEDSHKGCKGHSVYFLDTTYETQDERNLLLRVLDNYYPNEKDTEKFCA